MKLSTSTLNELDEYLAMIDCDPLLNDIIEFRNNFEKYEMFDVCVLSHKYDRTRSHFFKLIESNQTSNIVYKIFTYASQMDLYEPLKDQYKNIEIIYIKDEEKYGTLCGKRNYICNYLSGKTIFMIEDDVSLIHLPLRIEDDAVRVRSFKCSLELAFALWSFIIQKYNLKLTGLMPWITFRCFKFHRYGFTCDHNQCIQAISIDTKFAAENNIRFDESSGWEDYDINVNFALNNAPPTNIPILMKTASANGGKSTFSDIDERFMNNTIKLIEKWGLDVLKISTKLNLFNCKINWRNIKSGCKSNPIKITDEMRHQINEIMSMDINYKEKEKLIANIL